MVERRGTEQLLKSRNRTVARSFYRHLRAEGFSNEEIIDLSSELLDLVAEALQEETRPPAK